MAAKNQGLAVAGCNYVANDQIWKDHVTQEMVAAKGWSANWNFLTTKYEDLVKDDFPKKERQQLEDPTKSHLPAVIPLEQRVKVYPSPQPVPKTTSGQIGWRSGQTLLALEKYGQYAKPKSNIIKEFNWPNEAAI